ncbi:hypothetical protein ANOM_004297 [Aspergillus nomiae NRRL 13137]|uniref:Uncharacterized protein n=1 Tax=Aspergillus nomiae NRRL (strain ATCC 15546 / NRRL 13137 / CBS 260.88 / M93) TaxID=1509407 RepID=A0A0L1J9K9_ASPN3|nr:uncharacterized protein ANOM_004297 [Aspergillus nomiae NRRL 13137]KNG88417.1 hypothetical protein ANOM_004297 [Aspergillus nomiae NRRL 13137]
MSTAILQEFGRLRRREWSTGLQGLKGYTTLYIISRKAVYATHRKLDADLIENDYVHAYLIYPAKVFRQLAADPSAADYTIQWNQIRDTVGELVPMLQDQSRWTDIAYKTVEEDSELFLEDTVRGRNLFKYDRA